jgi:hypothetical protein
MNAHGNLGTSFRVKDHEERPLSNSDEQHDNTVPMSGAIPVMDKSNPTKEKDSNDVEQISQGGTSDERGEVEQTPPDPLFDNEEGTGIKYKTCEWWNVGLLMIAECISLGILSLPHAMATLGLAR